MILIHSIKKFYSSLIGLADLFSNLFLFAIRLYWGYSFQTAGCNKLLNISETASFFAQQKIPFPEFNAYLVGGVECIGGWLLMLGLATRLAALPLAFTMIGALLTAHYAGSSQIFTDQNAFLSQTPVTYLLTALTLFCFGPGAISLDYGIEKLVFKK